MIDREMFVQMLSKSNTEFEAGCAEVAGEQCYVVDSNGVLVWFNIDGSFRYIEPVRKNKDGVTE